MIKRIATSILTLGLVACASQPSSKRLVSTTTKEPTKKIDPSKVEETPLNLSPVPLEIARNNFIRDTATKYNLDPIWIEKTLAQAQFKDAIVAAMSRPAEQVKPWNEYRSMFIAQARIDGGRQFLASHKIQLKKSKLLQAYQQNSSSQLLVSKAAMVLAPGNTAYWTRYTHSPLNTRAAATQTNSNAKYNVNYFFAMNSPNYSHSVKKKTWISPH